MKERSIKMSRIYQKSFLIFLLFILVIPGKTFSQTTLGAGDYTVCIRNMHQTSCGEFLFDVYIQWDNPSKTNLFNFFQGGLDFDYAAFSNGGVISAQFVSGSADAAVPTAAQNPNWNLNQNSKQIRFQAKIVTPASQSAAVPPSPGWRLGTLRLFNTVPFSDVNPNFVWNFTTGTNRTQTKEGFYVDGSSIATGYVDQIPYPNHCSIPNPVLGVPCPTADAGGPYTACGDVQLNGFATFFTTSTWTSSGTGTFFPDVNTLNAIYQPSPADLLSGVTVTLTATTTTAGCEGVGSCLGSGPVSSTTITFTPVDDNNPCTADACNTLTGVVTHTPVPCGADLYSNILLEAYYLGGGLMSNPLFISGVTSNPLNSDLITISAMQAAPPHGLVNSQTDTLHTNGNVHVKFGPAVVPGNSYYLRITHRNHIETWSANPVVLNSTTTFTFSDSPAKAFSGNETFTHLTPGGLTGDGFGFALYCGDLTGEGSVDASDFLDMDPHIQNGDGGYIKEDTNGDGSVDATDYLWMDPNVQNGVGSNTP